MVDIRENAIYGMLLDVLHNAPVRHRRCAAQVSHCFRGSQRVPIGVPRMGPQMTGLRVSRSVGSGSQTV